LVIKCYPEKQSIENAKQIDDPLFMCVSHDGNTVLLAPADVVGCHITMLSKFGYKEPDIDKFYRVVINKGGADWTFICLEDYKGITNAGARIKTFYEDGNIMIANAIKAIGYDCPIEIPKRYRRHLNAMSE